MDNNGKICETKKYIAYGSNLNLKQMKHRCKTAKVIGSAVIHDYELLFKTIKSGCYATIEPCKGMSVPVLIWETTTQDELELDKYECYPVSYGKEDMQLEVEGKTITAYVYTMPREFKLGTPKQKYIDVILEGYKTAGFDTNIVYKALEKSNNN